MGGLPALVAVIVFPSEETLIARVIGGGLIANPQVPVDVPQVTVHVPD